MEEWTPERYEFEPRSTHLKRNLIGVVLFVILIIALAASFLLTWGPNLYSKPDWGFSVEVPSGYAIYREVENIGDNRAFAVAFYKSNRTNKGVGVEARQQEHPLSLENLISISKSDWQQAAPGFTIVSEGPRQVAGVSAWELDSYVTATLRAKYVFLVDNKGRGYVIFGMTRVESFAELDPVREKFIQSFRLI